MEENTKSPRHLGKMVYFNHFTFAEFFWTFLPAIYVFLLAVPAFALIWYAEPESEAELTVKILGSQWYWTYEYEFHALTLYSPTNICTRGGSTNLVKDYPDFFRQ